MHKDQPYIDGLLNNDRKVITKIYDLFLKNIIKLVVNNSGNRQDGEDVFQEGLMGVYSFVSNDGFKLGVPFEGLLFVICRNIWLKKLGKPLRKWEDWGLMSEDQFEKIDEEMKRQARFDLYREKLLELSEKCQKLIKLKLEKRTSKEICEELGIKTANASYNKYSRCRKQLTKKVHEDPRFDDLK